MELETDFEWITNMRILSATNVINQYEDWVRLKQICLHYSQPHSALCLDLLKRKSMMNLSFHLWF